ncbi:hypothetical protein KGO95_02275 [Patescibacteria group bacterium]|nr:hypothetical protein [Patescibacteria group bacterium]
MGHLYIAVYDTLDPVTGEKKYYQNAEILAMDDDEAERLALEKIDIFLKIESVLPGNRLMSPLPIFLRSMKDQETRRFIYHQYERIYDR